MPPLSTVASDPFDPVIVPFAEPPPRRRMTRPLRQRLDFRYLPVENAGGGDPEPAVYDVGGHTAKAPRRTGLLLDERV